MTSIKTIPTKKDVLKFIEGLENPQQKEESLTLLNFMKEVTKMEPVMWGDSIIGFGSYHYKYKSGREGDYFLVGFSPRKGKFSIYIMSGVNKYETLLQKLGKHSTGKSCLYVKSLKDIDMNVLREIIEQSIKDLSDYAKN